MLNRYSEDQMNKRIHHIIVGLLFVIYFLNGILAIPQLSVTADEGDHLSYGIRILKLHPEKVIPFEDASTMPVSAINALPRAVQQIVAKNELSKNDGGVSDILAGRYMTLVVCALICLFVYKWAKDTGGPDAGLFALFLSIICPSLNANNYLVTTDSYAALVTLLSGYFYYRFLQHSSWKNFICFSAMIGLAQVTKQSLILLFLFFAVVSIVVLASRGSVIRRWQINLFRLVVFCSVILLVINIAFLFNGTGKALYEYDFKSNFFSATKGWPLLSRIPLPLPEPFISGFDEVRYMLDLGSGHSETSPRSYLFGEYFTGKGPLYYYPCILLFKTPLGVWISLIVLMVLMFRKRVSNLRAVLFPMVYALFFIVMVVSLNTSQHSTRHLLMIYPLIYVSLGNIAASRWRAKKVYLAMMVTYSVITFYAYFPNLIAYTNELLWNKTKVYKTIASSNIDFGQGGKMIRSFLKDNPGVSFAPLIPESGKFVLAINDYLDLYGTGRYEWLRNFEPQKHVSHCYLYFDITSDALNRKGLNE
jgi:4-amino-4-deoxy-L-arabinose transferase-like glycosyltransferase